MSLNLKHLPGRHSQAKHGAASTTITGTSEYPNVNRALAELTPLFIKHGLTGTLNHAYRLNAGLTVNAGDTKLLDLELQGFPYTSSVDKLTVHAANRQQPEAAQKIISLLKDYVRANWAHQVDATLESGLSLKCLADAGFTARLSVERLYMIYNNYLEGLSDHLKTKGLMLPEPKPEFSDTVATVNGLFNRLRVDNHATYNDEPDVPLDYLLNVKDPEFGMPFAAVGLNNEDISIMRYKLTPHALSVLKHLPGRHDQHSHAGLKADRRPLSAAQLEQRRNAGKARGAQMTSAQMIEMRKLVKPESLSISGKKGAKRVVELYGDAYLSDRLAAHREQHPSGPEKAVIAMLDAAGLVYKKDYVREHRLGVRLYADFYFPSKKKLLEVDEKVWHAGAADSFINDPARLTRDLAKTKLAAKQGLKLYRVTADDIRAGTAADLLKKFGILD